MKKLLFILGLLCTSFSFAANLNLDPSYLSLKMYKFAVSESPFCTSPITILENETPDYIDVLGSPEFGNGSVTDGTYPCVIIEFSSYIKYKPSEDSDGGNCSSTVESTLDVCSSATTSTLVDGTTVTCDANENRIAMYLSTTSTQTTGVSGHTAFEAPTSVNDATKGFNLAAALVVDGTSTGIFTVNGTDKICDGDDSGCSGNSGTCEMAPPLFTFSKE
jgi:hypothetical protein